VARLIVNADDLGLTEGVNAGILEVHARGIVTSASLMVDAPAAIDAASAARAHPNLSIGLHFAEDRAEVLDDPAALTSAFAAQLGRFRCLMGRDPTHIDSHHHVHTSRLPAFTRLARPLGVPLRGDGHIRYLGNFFAAAGDLELVSLRHLKSILAPHTQTAAVELGCHPGHVTAELSSSYRQARAVEVETLSTPGLRGELERAGFELINFAALSP